MKKLLALLLAAMAVGLTACGPAASQATPTPVVTGYEVDLPDGFEALEMEGVDRYYMNADGSNLNVLVSEKTESDDKAFGSVTADALREALEEGFLDSLEAEVDITDVSFTQNPVDGFEAYQYTCTYALWGVEMEQFIVCVNADKLYTFTYTDTTGAWMEEFQRSGENIRFETEAP